jgi:hypothetical protein
MSKKIDQIYGWLASATLAFLVLGIWLPSWKAVATSAVLLWLSMGARDAKQQAEERERTEAKQMPVADGSKASRGSK